MTLSNNLSVRHLRLMHRVHARLSGFSRPATGIVSQPEPRSIGSFAKGRQLCAGNILLAGSLIEAPETSIWSLTPPSVPFQEASHGFGWLDDLASVGDLTARRRAQEWTFEWIDRYGRGSGAGWLPDLTGRRIIRWIHHTMLLLRGQDAEMSEKFYRSLAHQTLFLSRRWSKTTPGLPRFEVLTGLIYAGLSLSGMDHLVAPATSALAKECRLQIDETGGILTRNPEELLEVFTLLTWAASALRDAGWTPAKTHVEAIDRIAPTLRTLRHSDGGLARFHGGGRGVDGRLDHALAQSGNRTMQADGLAMGYARLSAGRTSVIVDASLPPEGRASVNAHASTLAFELTSGRRPVIVNCGSGVSFGEEWRTAGRATPSHSTLHLDGVSSSKLGRKLTYAGVEREVLVDGPTDVPVQMTHTVDGFVFEGAHDGYVATNGLTHARKLELTLDGRAIVGEDTLIAVNSKAEKLFDRALDASKLSGFPMFIKFHLHPDVEAEVDLGGKAISMMLKSGEVWILRFEGAADLTLEPSVYLETGRLKPRATKQAVLSWRAMEYATRIRWSLSKAHDTDIGVRDMNWIEADDQ